jgi:hypothetical protein
MTPGSSRLRGFFSSRRLSIILAATALGCSACARGQGHPDDRGASAALGSDAASDAGLAVGTALPLDAGNGHFEGQILMMIEEGADQPTSRPDELPPSERFTFTAMGDAYRWDIFDRSQPRGDFRVYDRSAHRFYTVMQSQSIIFSTPESSHLVQDPTASFILEDLHKEGRIANQVCELYRTERPPLRYDICATDKFTTFPFHMMPGLMGQTIPFGGELITRGLFPLLVSVYDTTVDAGAPRPGKPTVRTLLHPLRKFEVVLIDPKVVDPVVFELPKYTIQRTDYLQSAKKKIR